MFDSILVPLDRSALAECVLPHVAAINRAFESDISLLQVMDSTQYTPQNSAVDPIDWQLRRIESEYYLQNVAVRLQQADVNRTQQYIGEGAAADCVVEFAREHNASLIILSSHGQSGLSQWNISSVVQKIAHRAYTSLMIVRASNSNEATPDMLSQFRYQRLLLPLDGSQRAECVLPAAVRLAQTHDAELDLVHVVHEPEMPRRTPISPDDVDLTEQFINRNRVEAEQYLEEVGSRLNCRVRTRVITSKNVGATLHDIGMHDDIDLVLVSAHGYSGLSRWPHGSLVHGLITYSQVPTLVIQDMEYSSDSNDAAYSQMMQSLSVASRRESILVGGR